MLPSPHPFLIEIKNDIVSPQIDYIILYCNQKAFSLEGIRIN